MALTKIITDNRSGDWLYVVDCEPRESFLGGIQVTTSHLLHHGWHPTPNPNGTITWVQKPLDNKAQQ